MSCVYSPADFSLWSIFSKVNKSYLERVVLLHVFGERGSSAIFVTSDDVVYAVGSNIRAIDPFKVFSLKPEMFGFLGIGETVHTNTPIELTELSGSQIVCLSSGLDHTLALSSSGDLYIWGRNNFHQLGNYHVGTLNRPFLKFKNQVLKISTADNYSLILLNNHKLVHFGSLKTEKEIITIPTGLNFPDCYIVDISCGSKHACALTNNGDVYIWGDNSQGQLGHGFVKGFYESPVLFKSDIKIEKIGCGSTSTLVLYDNGELGSLGCVGDVCKFKSVVKNFTITNKEQILCVHTVQSCHFFSLISSDKMFGLRPLSLKSKNWINIYGGKSTPMFTRQGSIMISSPVVEKRDIGNQLYDNKEHSDLTILVQDGEVYVHKLILKTYSEHFNEILESNVELIDVQIYKPKAYRSYLKYLYTGLIDPLDVLELIELYNISISYSDDKLREIVVFYFKKQLSNENVNAAYENCQNYDELKTICEEYASCMLDKSFVEGLEELATALGRILLTPESVSKAYAHAQELQLVRLKDMCAQYASQHWDRVVLSKSFELLSPQVRCDFMKDSAVVKTKGFSSHTSSLETV